MHLSISEKHSGAVVINSIEMLRWASGYYILTEFRAISLNMTFFKLFSSFIAKCCHTVMASATYLARKQNQDLLLKCQKVENINLFQNFQKLSTVYK